MQPNNAAIQELTPVDECASFAEDMVFALLVQLRESPPAADTAPPDLLAAELFLALVAPIAHPAFRTCRMMALAEDLIDAVELHQWSADWRDEECAANALREWAAAV